MTLEGSSSVIDDAFRLLNDERGKRNKETVKVIYEAEAKTRLSHLFIQASLSSLYTISYAGGAKYAGDVKTYFLSLIKSPLNFVKTNCFSVISVRA